MTTTESLLHRILPHEDGDLRPLAHAVDVLGELMFDRRIDPYDIRLKRDVYPAAALRLPKKSTPGAVCRSAQRMAHSCWDHGDLDILEEVLGYRPEGAPPPEKPKWIMVYLATYLRLGMSYRRAVERDPSLLS